MNSLKWWEYIKQCHILFKDILKKISYIFQHKTNKQTEPRTKNQYIFYMRWLITHVNNFSPDWQKSVTLTHSHLGECICDKYVDKIPYTNKTYTTIRIAIRTWEKPSLWLNNTMVWIFFFSIEKIAVSITERTYATVDWLTSSFALWTCIDATDLKNEMDQEMIKTFIHLLYFPASVICYTVKVFAF